MLPVAAGDGERRGPKKLKGQVLAHLLTDAPAPVEYLELVLCRDIYHCTPPELGEVDMQTINAHLACLDGEAQARQVLRARQG